MAVEYYSENQMTDNGSGGLNLGDWANKLSIGDSLSSLSSIDFFDVGALMPPAHLNPNLNPGPVGDPFFGAFSSLDLPPVTPVFTAFDQYVDSSGKFYDPSSSETVVGGQFTTDFW